QFLLQVRADERAGAHAVHVHASGPDHGPDDGTQLLDVEGGAGLLHRSRIGIGDLLHHGRKGVVRVAAAGQLFHGGGASPSDLSDLGGQGQSQLAVAAEVDGATKAYDGRLGSGAVLGELGDGGGRGPFGVVDDPLSDTVLSGCKRRKKGADPKDRGRNGRGGCLGPVRAVFRWLRDVRHGGKFLSVVLKSQRGDGKKSGESRIPRDASGSKCFARGGVVPVQGFSSVGRAEAGECSWCAGTHPWTGRSLCRVSSPK